MRASLSLRAGAFAVVAFGMASSASAQFNDQWVTFNKDNTMLGPSPTSISDINNETDVAWGDLDRDGWTDLVVVRKEPFTSTGKRTNLLLINENGELKNRTNIFASASDVGGDNGFNTATNDRDVVIVDVDQDGWLDVVTATTLSDGDPKHIGHPRVYMNLGDNPPGSGNWLGLQHQDARIPQFFTLNGAGNPVTAVNPRFCSVAFGDVTGDGYPELYFGDYDSSGAGGSGQPSGSDLNNRLLVNDGNGFFTDSHRTRLSSTHLLSAFGAASAIADMNGDGHNDIVKQTSLNPPQHVAISYNNPASQGFFNIYHDFMNNEPYHISVGDLNNDGRQDIVVTSDFDDRYRFNTGNDGLGRATWGSNNTFDFLSGGDDGFGSNNLIADLDHDGWNDVLIADVDVDIGGYNRRLHIYHNRGVDGVHEGGSPVLREERTSNGSWLGVVGMDSGDLQGTHDVGILDVDNDGDVEMVVSRRDGTDVWNNNTDPIFCQEDAGGGSGDTLSVCGQPLGTGRTATFSYQAAGGVFPKFLVLLIASDNQQGPALNFGVDTLENVIAFETFLSSGSGAKNLPVTGGSGGNFTVEAHVQIVALDLIGSTWESSNAVNLRLLE